MRVMSVVKNGIGIMPPLEELLSSQEIEAVAHYVSIAASQ
jgi:mono/diheme cytochrome c family protein